MNREDAIWLAGLLEGEGCFDLHRGTAPRVRLTMTDRDVVGRAASLFGSTVRLTLRKAPKSPTFHAEKQGPAAVTIMEAVLPYMGARRSAKIAEVLSEFALRPQARKGDALPFGRPLTRPPGLADPLSPTVINVNTPGEGATLTETIRKIDQALRVQGRLSSSRA